MNPILIDYTIDFYKLDYIDIANHLVDLMLGHYVISNKKCYKWDGLIWSKINLQHELSNYVNNLKQIYIDILEYQKANSGEPICSVKFNNFLKLFKYNRLSQILMNHPYLKYDGQWNANKNLIVYPDGLWDMVAGAYIVNSKDYYINRVVREEPEKPNMD